MPIGVLMTSVLLIDDDRELLSVLSALLESLGYETRTASNGVEGLARFAEEPTRIVVTDLVMPDKEGLETIRELRAISPDVRILAISGGGLTLDARDVLAIARELGADDVLAKPFTREQLAESMFDLEAA